MAAFVPSGLPVVALMILLRCYSIVADDDDTSAFSSGNLTETELMDKLLQNYDARMRPPHDKGSPTLVKISLVIDSIDSIDVLEMEYTVHILLSQLWRDERLSYAHYDHQLPHNRSYIAADFHFITRIWRPDVFIENENSGHFHELTTKNNQFRIFPNGLVRYNVRLTLVLACHMWLAKYPLDEQTCPLRLQSYALTTDEQTLVWRENEPIRLTKEVNLPQFQFNGYTIKNEIITEDKITGNFSSCVLKMSFGRQIGYHLLASYIPMIILVMVSWVSFWFDVDATVGRVTLGIMTLLTVNSLSYSVGKNLPIVSYAKAIDIWTGGCATFVFAAFLEFSLVSYLTRIAKKQRRMLKASQDAERNEHETYFGGSSRTQPGADKTTFGFDSESIESNGFKRSAADKPTSGSSSARNMFNVSIKMAKRVDIMARMLFPLMFLVFNITYWMFYVFWM